MATQKQLDMVTAGQIREYYEEILDRQIVELGGLIRKGYHTKAMAAKYLEEDIGKTLTRLEDIKTFAGLPLLKELINK